MCARCNNSVDFALLLSLIFRNARRLIISKIIRLAGKIHWARNVHFVFPSAHLNSVGLSVPHRKHITSSLRAQQVNTVYRIVTMLY
jgi:hypothetical protein